MQVTIEDAYKEACLALGELTVQHRLVIAEMNRVQEQSQREAESTTVTTDG